MYIHACVQSLSTHAYSHPPTHAHIHTMHLSNFIPDTFRNFPKTFPIVVVVFPIMINYDMNTYKLQYTINIHSNFSRVLHFMDDNMKKLLLRFHLSGQLVSFLWLIKKIEDETFMSVMSVESL